MIYDKEMLTIMHALAKFRQYLVGCRFKINTPQQPEIHHGVERIEREATNVDKKVAEL